MHLRNALITHTVRYTEMSPTRFKGIWRLIELLLSAGHLRRASISSVNPLPATGE